MKADLTLIITAEAKAAPLEASLRDFARHKGDLACEILVLASGFTGEEVRQCASLGRALFDRAFGLALLPEDACFWTARNEAALQAKGETIFFLDAGGRPAPGCLQNLLSSLRGEEKAAAASPLLLYDKLGHLPDRVAHAGLCLTPVFTIQPLYHGFPSGHPAVGKKRRPQLVSASCLLMPRALFTEYGGFEPQKHADMDLCARLVSGGRSLLLEPQAKMYWPDDSEEEGDFFPFQNEAPFMKAVGSLLPDMEEQLAGDAFCLRLSPWLSFVPSPSPARDSKLTSLCSKLSSLPELEDLANAEPFCLAAHARIAGMLEAEQRWEEAFYRRLLIARLAPSPESVLDLYCTAKRASYPKTAQKAYRHLAYAIPTMEHLSDLARTIFFWSKQQGRNDIVQVCDDWLKQREDFRRERLLPLLRRAGEAGLLRAPLQFSGLVYTALLELGRDDAAGEDARMEESLRGLTRKPLISLIMPVYNPEAAFLEQALDSVLAQSYGNWELCIADDASSDPAVPAILEAYARRDARIKVERRQENGHICAASNTALAMARGEYAALMDHDDELHRHALARVAMALDEKPDALLIYSDEDKIERSGHRYGPYLKTPFDADLLLGQNFYSHFGVYAMDLVRRVGGFRPGYEGSQDHDLVLRCSALIRPDQILHLPYVLYHWRSHENSTAGSASAKPYAATAGIRAVCESLASAGRNAEAHRAPRCPTHYLVREKIPSPAPALWLFSCCDELSPRLERWAARLLRQNTYEGFSLCLLYKSGRPSLPGMDGVKLLRVESPGIAEALSDGAIESALRVMTENGLKPTDIVGGIGPGLMPAIPDWAAHLAGEASRHEIGAVGGRIWSKDQILESMGFGITRQGRIFPEHAGLHWRDQTYLGLTELTRATAFLSGDFFFARAQCWQDFLTAGTQGLWPLEFCMRAREAGLRVICLPHADLLRNAAFAPFAMPGTDGPGEQGEPGKRDRPDKENKGERDNPDLQAYRAFLDRWRERLPGIALHPELCPVPGGFGLAAFE